MTDRIKREISLGSLINLVAVVVAVAVGWGVMSERGQHTREGMDALTRTLTQETAARREAQGGLESRIRVLESSQARADERFNSVLQVLGRIEAQQQRIEARLERIEGR